MKKLLDLLFIKNTKINRNMFNALYYSYESDSFAGFDTNILLKNQKYDSYEILKERHTKIAENHNEYKYFIKLDNKKIFIRIISDYNDIIYDIMIYNMTDDNTYNKFNKIFFPNIINIPKSLDNINKAIIYVDDIHINLIKNEKLFVSYLGYEDWDYKNKCLNMLDSSIINENPLADFKKEDFIKTYEFKMNGLNNISLKCEFKYKDGFYYINNVEKAD